MYIYFPECIHNAIKTDANYIKLTNYSDMLNMKYSYICDIGKFPISDYNHFCMEYYNCDLVTLCYKLIEHNCVQYLNLWKILTEQYNISQLQTFLTDFTYKEDVNLRLYILEQIITQSSRDSNIYITYQQKYIKLYESFSIIPDSLLDNWYYQFKTEVYLYDLLKYITKYRSQCLNNLYEQLQNKYISLTTSLSDHSCSIWFGLVHLLLNFVNMKFSDDYSQSHIYEDLQSIDWYSAFDYQYKHFDIRYLKFQYTLLIYHLTNRHSNNIIKTIQLLSDSMNVVLHDIPQLRKANKFLQNADDVSILSLIYFLLNLPFKNTLQLQEHEKQYVLSKTFLDNPVHAYSCLKYTKSYWQRHFLGLEKTLTSLQSLSS